MSIWSCTLTVYTNGSFSPTIYEKSKITLQNHVYFKRGENLFVLIDFRQFNLRLHTVSVVFFMVLFLRHTLNTPFNELKPMNTYYQLYLK